MARIGTGFRRNSPGRRRYAIGAALNVAEAVGDLEPGIDVVGLTSGQFSLLDLIEYCLARSGPADVFISTWTAGVYDIDRAVEFVRQGNIRSMRWFVDPQIFMTMPENAGVLIEHFGPEAFRFAKTHAKVVVIRGDDLEIVIRSSMNLNKNLRVENFDISVDVEMAAHFSGWFDAVWDGVPEAQRTEDLKLLMAIFKRYDEGRVKSNLPSQKALARALPRLRV